MFSNRMSKEKKEKLIFLSGLRCFRMYVFTAAFNKVIPVTLPNVAILCYSFPVLWIEDYQCT